MFSRLPRTLLMTTGPLALLGTLLGGCANSGEGQFPSLAKRPIEDMGLTRIPDAIEPPPAAPADGALTGQIAELRGQANQGQARFNAELAATRARVAAARGSAPASDAWMEAQMAISGLEAARRPSVEALASLDQLAVARQNGGQRAGEGELAEASDAVRALVAAQSEMLKGFKGSLRQP